MCILPGWATFILPQDMVFQNATLLFEVVKTNIPARIFEMHFLTSKKDAGKTRPAGPVPMALNYQRIE